MVSYCIYLLQESMLTLLMQLYTKYSKTAFQLDPRKVEEAPLRKKVVPSLPRHVISNIIHLAVYKDAEIAKVTYCHNN